MAQPSSVPLHRPDAPPIFSKDWRTALKKKLIKIWHKDKYLYLIFLPPLVYFIVFHYATLYGLLIAFKDFRISRGIGGSEWVGLEHFQDFFANPYSFQLIRNTIFLRLAQIAFGFPAPIILALLLHELISERLKRVVQSISYLPHFLSLVVVAGMIIDFVASDGMLNIIASIFGIEPKSWLLYPEYFAPIFVISGIWQHVGWASIIYLAALTAIDSSLYEAAAIDGANRWHRLRQVTLPGIIPTITIMFLLRLGTIMTVDYQKILLLYTPATYETADVLGTYIYRRGLLNADFSLATAVGLLQSFVGLIFVIGSNKFAKRVGETSLW